MENGADGQNGQRRKRLVDLKVKLRGRGDATTLHLQMEENRAKAKTLSQNQASFHHVVSVEVLCPKFNAWLRSFSIIYILYHLIS